jgi:glycosyltransferase involved in cell wall biosynthesis
LNGRIDVLVATPLGRGGKGGIDRLMDVVADELSLVPEPKLRAAFGVTRGPRSIVLSPFYLVGFLGRTIWMRITGRIDVLHINLSSKGSTYRKVVVSWIARLLRVPYVVHLHGSDFRTFFEQSSPLWQRAIRSMLESSARVLVLGTVWREFVRLIAPGAHAEVLPNATRSRPPCDQQAEETRFVFLGRLGARKGTPDFVAALTAMSRDANWTALLAGDGDFEPTVGAVAKAGLQDRVRVVRWLDPAGVEEVLRWGNVLVLPSYDENLPMSVIEGMSAGMAIVASPAGATADIVRHGHTGLLVEAGDVAGLEAALRSLAANPGQRRTFGAHAKSWHAENLEIGIYVRRLFQLWQAAAGRAKAERCQLDRGDAQ